MTSPCTFSDAPYPRYDGFDPRCYPRRVPVCAACPPAHKTNEDSSAAAGGVALVEVVGAAAVSLAGVLCDNLNIILCIGFM